MEKLDIMFKQESAKFDTPKKINRAEKKSILNLLNCWNLVSLQK